MNDLNRLAMRATRLCRFVEIKAPGEVIENEIRLVRKAVVDLGFPPTLEAAPYSGDNLDEHEERSTPDLKIAGSDDDGVPKGSEP